MGEKYTAPTRFPDWTGFNIHGDHVPIDLNNRRILYQKFLSSFLPGIWVRHAAFF